MTMRTSSQSPSNDPGASLAELERALGRTPVYAAWRARDPGPAAGVDARYAALPATSKQLLRAAAPRGFVPRGADLDAALAGGSVVLVETGGTTGAPTTLVWDQRWWNESERLSWGLHAGLAAACTGSHREAVLASPRCVGPPVADRPLTQAERTLGRLLFVNEDADVARWSDATVRRMVAELGDFAPVVLEADPAYLAALCAAAERLGLELPRPRLVVYTYARPSRLQLARIERLLPVPSTSSYGSTETGYVFVGCEAGRLHQNRGSCRVELAPLAGRDDVAELLVTPFRHPWMCLLRFAPGDVARPARAPCPCGRDAGRVLERIEGRVEELTRRDDGAPVTPAELDDALAAAPSAGRIVSYQLEQRGPALRLRATASGALDGAAIAARLRALYGRADPVVVEAVAALAPERSGKYALARRLP